MCASHLYMYNIYRLAMLSVYTCLYLYEPKKDHSLVNHQLGEHKIALVEHGIRVLVIDGAVHQRMRADKVQHRIRQT